MKQMIDQFEQEHPLEPTRPPTSVISLRNVLAAAILVIVIVLGAIVTLLRGNPAPPFSTLR